MLLVAANLRLLLVEIQAKKLEARVAPGVPVAIPLPQHPGAGVTNVPATINTGVCIDNVAKLSATAGAGRTRSSTMIVRESDPRTGDGSSGGLQFMPRHLRLGVRQVRVRDEG